MTIRLLRRFSAVCHLSQKKYEHERLQEVKTLISNLNINTHLFANTISNPVPLTGYLPKDTQMLIKELDSIIGQVDENQLKTYRKNIRSL